mmetsp:Transcript_11663/g.37025  ORF Transcript_11663/g.37025 Transcript_11663/m.37025 type:complete len:208 (-) Transcript_11663:419-1042(-)
MTTTAATTTTTRPGGWTWLLPLPARTHSFEPATTIARRLRSLRCSALSSDGGLTQRLHLCLLRFVVQNPASAWVPFLPNHCRSKRVTRSWSSSHCLCMVTSTTTPRLGVTSTFPTHGRSSTQRSQRSGRLSQLNGRLQRQRPTVPPCVLLPALPSPHRTASTTRWSSSFRRQKWPLSMRPATRQISWSDCPPACSCITVHTLRVRRT